MSKINKTHHKIALIFHHLKTDKVYLIGKYTDVEHSELKVLISRWRQKIKKALMLESKEFKVKSLLFDIDLKYWYSAFYNTIPEYAYSREDLEALPKYEVVDIDVIIRSK